MVRPATSAKLAAPTADLAIVVGGVSFTNTATAANLIPGPRGISFEGTRYYIGYGTLTAPVADAGGTFFAQSTNLCTINNAGAVAAMTNAPRGFIDIKGYQSRIWGLGGIDDPGSGTTFNPLALFFTNPIGPGGGNAASFADWKDPVSGLTNKILMDGDTTDPGVGLATVRNGLLIFRQQSIWILRGSTTANYALLPVSRQVGCVDPRSIVETDKGVYFMSTQGLMVTDGVSVRNASGVVLHTLQSAVAIAIGAIQSSFGGYVTATVASGGQLIISMGAASVTSGAPDGHIQPVWCGMFDPESNAWTRITSSLFASDGTITVPGNTYPGWVFSTPDQRLLSIGDKYVTQWEAATASTTLATFTAGPSVPGTGANDASFGSVSWALAAGFGSATLQKVGLNNISKYMTQTNYGFSIPSTATITGIQADITKRRGSGGSSPLIDARVRLIRAGTVQTTDRASGAAWPPVDTDTPYGGSADLWGASWTPSDINNSGFGVAISAENTDSFTSADADIGAVTMTVYYTLSGSTKQQSFVRQPGLYDTDAAGNFQPIPFRWLTRWFPVVGTTTLTRKFGQMKRWFCDYVFQGLGLPSANGFTVKPVDATGTLIPGSAPIQLAPTNNSMTSSSISGGQPNASTSIERSNDDLASEISDLAFDVTWVDAQQSSQPSFVAAELYGLGIEYQPTRDLR